MSAFLNLLLAICLLNGCANTPAGIAREQKTYSAATNALSVAQQIAPFLPPPVSTPVGAVLAGVSAALAAWNLHQQRTLSALRKVNAATSAAVAAQQQAYPCSAQPLAAVPSLPGQAPPAPQSAPIATALALGAHSGG